MNLVYSYVCGITLTKGTISSRILKKSNSLCFEKLSRYNVTSAQIIWISMLNMKLCRILHLQDVRATFLIFIEV